MPNNPVENTAEIERLFTSAPFIKELGLKLVEIAPGECTTTLALAKRHHQQDGFVHAGVLTTVADHTAGTAGASLIAAGQYVLSTDIKVCLMRAARGDRLHCRARVLKSGRHLIFTESEVFCEDELQEQAMVVKAMVTLAVVADAP
jgi:uncharacterized protein (TIGR00369 family)